MVSPVYFYYANLIGYTRVLLLATAFYNCYEDPMTFFLCYGISEVLDALDGHVARAYGQTSKFGAVLDMLTDRAATMMLMIVLSHFYTTRWITYCFLFLVTLDIVSHWAHMYSSMTRGLSSHKTIPVDNYQILQIYYNNRRVMGLLCVGNEGFWLALYLLQFTAHPLASLFMFVTAPLAAIKNFINLVQLAQAGKDLVALDDLARLEKKEEQRISKGTKLKR
eukprot:TRINITY_DN1421_c0_g1_i2.p1 TRINITY_DN1421_c0_g1~~TRINITY_DN1421_c0_g1_i2.p1  ORF type:complete len:233 (+),score=45.87 TRINITY_DN1421_c0_g1_i2:34-699(+)